MVYDHYARFLFPRRQLRRFVEVRVPEEETLELASGLGVLTRADWLSWGDVGTRVGGLLERLKSLPVGDFCLTLSGLDSTSQLSSQLPVPEAPGDLPRCALTVRIAGQTQIETGIVWEDSIFPPSAQAGSACVCLGSIPASASDRECAESEAKERYREMIRRRDGPGATSPRSPPTGPVSSPGEQGPLGATELPRLRGSPSPGVWINQGAPSSTNRLLRSPLVKSPLLFFQLTLAVLGWFPALSSSLFSFSPVGRNSFDTFNLLVTANSS
ncbi:hypothetical protein Efla_000519 [Eimeria flavescens]